MRSNAGETESVEISPIRHSPRRNQIPSPTILPKLNNKGSVDRLSKQIESHYNNLKRRRLKLDSPPPRHILSSAENSVERLKRKQGISLLPNEISTLML